MLGISDDPHFRPGSNFVLLQRFWNFTKIRCFKSMSFYVEFSDYFSPKIVANIFL